ncbi:hypothetical protein BDZ89DRAFT_278399 [Hymenopellis radicata]|nr:hypothetical protein BDZ89DRAFT_278399 [Hymenopellis radicata]
MRVMAGDPDLSRASCYSQDLLPPGVFPLVSLILAFICFLSCTVDPKAGSCLVCGVQTKHHTLLRGSLAQWLVPLSMAAAFWQSFLQIPPPTAHERSVRHCDLVLDVNMVERVLPRQV